ncbi:response regulator [Methylobacterium sp. NMS12]|uniref:response regulator n=1 Tax=Methylobacterium sp. NMS12 TaxID=3079766 RepID=UPI003F885550
MLKKPLTGSPVVLVVEDNALVRMVAKEMLEESGFEVLEADTADAALVILEREGEISTLFTDIDMPGSMDGVALATQVAARWPHIRLVVTSGRTCMSDGDLPDAGRFLPKPYHQSDLLDVIARAA